MIWVDDTTRPSAVLNQCSEPGWEELNKQHWQRLVWAGPVHVEGITKVCSGQQATQAQHAKGKSEDKC